LNQAVKIYGTGQRILQLQRSAKKTAREPFSNTEKGELEIIKVDLAAAVLDFSLSYEDEIAYTEEGKPYFRMHKECCYNLSHSGQYAVCIIGDTPVGIDVEGRRPFRLNVAKRFFSPQECEWIMEPVNDAQEEQDKRKEQRFFRLWTLKEAYVKATGIGIGKGIKTIEFTPQSDNSDRLKFADVDLAEKFYMYEYEWDGYRIAAIISRRQVP
jgi:4'-phosphopantetheinyl transferase